MVLQNLPFVLESTLSFRHEVLRLNMLLLIEILPKPQVADCFICHDVLAEANISKEPVSLSYNAVCFATVSIQSVQLGLCSVSP